MAPTLPPASTAPFIYSARRWASPIESMILFALRALLMSATMFETVLAAAVSSTGCSKGTRAGAITTPAINAVPAAILPPDFAVRKLIYCVDVAVTGSPFGGVVIVGIRLRYFVSFAVNTAVGAVVSFPDIVSVIGSIVSH